MDTNHSVLIIDDDPMIRKTLSDILKVKGYSTIAVAQGKEALDKVKSIIPSVALIDLKLEYMSGLELMKEIKNYASEIECLVLTGHASQVSAIEAINLGAYGYMQKPYDIEQLLMMIRRAIEKKASNEALRKSEERYRSLFDGIPVGSYRSTPGGEILDANKAMVDMLGYPTRESLLAAKATDFYKDPKDRKRWKKTMEDEGVVRGFDVQLKKCDGSVIWVEDDTRAIFDKDGQILYYEGSLRDITERKQMEEKLHQSQKELAFSHQLLLSLGNAAQAVQRCRTFDEVYQNIGDEFSKHGLNAGIFILSALLAYRLSPEPRVPGRAALPYA